MNEMEKYRDRPAPTEGTIVDSHWEPAAAAAGGPNTLRGIMRRWYIVLIVFILICGAGLPAIWFLVKPKYQAVAAIRVAPIINPILFSDSDSERVLPMYEAFVNTQVDLITSEPVLQQVADTLADRDLLLFKKFDLISRKTEKINPLQALKGAVQAEAIQVGTERRSELIKITVQNPSEEEAQLIANTLQQAYMTVEESKLSNDDKRLNLLDDKRNTLTSQLQTQREVIQNMSNEFGALDMTSRYEFMLQRVADIQAQLTQVEATTLALETEIKTLMDIQEPNMVIEGLTERRQTFINSDPTLISLTQRVALQEEQLVILQQELAATNPQLEKQQKILAAFKQRVKDRRAELEKMFNENVATEQTTGRADLLKELRAKLKQTHFQQENLNQRKKEADAETITLGRKHLEIKEKQEELALTKELYDTVQREIQKLLMERGRPARITQAYKAASMEMPNKRMKLLAAVVFAALAGGFFLAFLRAKADHRLRTPDDVIRRIGVPVLGTTVSPSRRDRKRLPELVANDYQTIRANLGLRSGGQIPHRLVVTSPGMREGKTTFAINLATSIARAGSKVLLLDGDFRKPDIAHILQIPESQGTLADVLLELCDFREAIYPMRQQGYDVLSMNGRNAAQALENLGNRQVAQRIHALSQDYDHVIIDSPPVLIAPDALLWARMADAVVICSLAGQTDGPDLAEAVERLSQAQVKILGNVLSNVNSDHNYYRYSYEYHHNGSKAKTNGIARQKNRLILALQDAEPKKDSQKK